MSETVQVDSYHANELTTGNVTGLIRQRKSFEITHIADMSVTVNELERVIEKECQLTCRVYTEYRSATVAGSFWGTTAIAGELSAAAIGVHNLATWNPDYELGKNYVARTLSVKYKK